MKLIETGIIGCYVVEPIATNDPWGSIHHAFQQSDFHRSEPEFRIDEAIFSVSSKNVLKGMHFQVPPRCTSRLVSVVFGEVFDAVLDLRKESATYLQSFTTRLSEKSRCMIYIPHGVAHGFCSMEDNTTVLYMISGVHSPEHDKGIRWNTVPIQWPIKDPIISERDQKLQSLDQFESPF